MFEYKTEEFGIKEITDRLSMTYQMARTDLTHLTDSRYLGMRKKEGHSSIMFVMAFWRIQGNFCITNLCKFSN